MLQVNYGQFPETKKVKFMEENRKLALETVSTKNLVERQMQKIGFGKNTDDQTVNLIIHLGILLEVV